MPSQSNVYQSLTYVCWQVFSLDFFGHDAWFAVAGDVPLGLVLDLFLVAQPDLVVVHDE